MLSINTNLSSLIVQNSMKQSTNHLNTAIERLTTGFKINHAKDNAANYSIATNMTTKLGALQVAEDNCAMGLDLLTVAEDTLSQIQDHLTRLRDLAEQASNGTYGEQSLKTISKEAGALVEEINRLYSTAKYNGIALFDSTQGAGCDMESLPEVGPSGFINEVQKRDTSAMTTLASVDPAVALTSGTYSISTPEELAKLATMTNNGLVGKNCEFVLSADIDLSGYAEWEPIGNGYGGSPIPFTATFDGNGYKVTNLNISNANITYRGYGLFGYVNGGKILNTGVSGTISCRTSSGLLVGLLAGINPVIDNCYTEGSISGYATLGGLLGTSAAYDTNGGEIKNSYSTASVNALYNSSLAGTVQFANFGGLVGLSKFNITNCFATGDITGTVDNFNLGGLCGVSSGTIRNSYATGNITGYGKIGGLVAWAPGNEPPYEGLIENCYSSGDLTIMGAKTGSASATAGGILGNGCNATVRNCTSDSKIISTGSDPTYLGAITSNQAASTTSSYVVDVSNCLFDSSINPDIEGVCGFGGSSNVLDVAKYNPTTSIDFQIGINANDSSMINLTTSFKLSGVYELSSIGLNNEDYLSKIDNLLATVSAKQVEYGATENRLNSALEEISTQYENLLSSRSTIQDADIADISSEYIRQQILQQASATLLATANQSPSIALQLI